MSAKARAKLIDINADNVAEEGFFCYMSKRKAEGYQRKMNWLKARFAEGLRIKMFELPQRGFIEYIPGEFAWRTVDARGYMFIHCLWVVGKSKGLGLGGRLLKVCIDEARASGMHGVAMLTSEGNWLAGQDLLLHHGFRAVAQALPSFRLMALKFDDAPSPALWDNWEQKAKKFPRGLTVFRSDQCPYIDDATQLAVDTAKKLGVEHRTVELKTCEDVRNLSPSPFGVFSIVYNGKLLSYHYLLEKELLELLQEEH